jgi:hypothetical protein
MAYGLIKRLNDRDARVVVISGYAVPPGGASQGIRRPAEAFQCEVPARHPVSGCSKPRPVRRRPPTAVAETATGRRLAAVLAVTPEAPASAPRSWCGVRPQGWTEFPRRFDPRLVTARCENSTVPPANDKPA